MSMGQRMLEKVKLFTKAASTKAAISDVPELKPEHVDRLISSLSNLEASEEAAALATEKIDHLIYAMHTSGRLAKLAPHQIESIFYSLQMSGLLNGWMKMWGKSSLAYCEDGLATIHNADFMQDPAFIEAYQRGIAASGGDDLTWRWRVHVGLWAAFHAKQLEGDFVECGVNRGFLSSAIMCYMNWDTCGKRFFLMDTFKGLDPAFISDEEEKAGKLSACNHYKECYEEVVRNFAEFKNVVLIRGSIPTTLPLAITDKICYLHLDMNCAPPEVAAINYFWDKLVTGAVVLLDDYGHATFETQKQAMDSFAAERGVQVLSLPTGQGMILKPGR